MKTLLRFVFSKLFLKQFILALAIGALLFLATVIALRVFTHHGHTVQVPDIKGYNEAQVARVISDNTLRYEIIDSVYSDEVLPGTVFDQIPPAGSFVKENRKLFIVLNAKKSEKVIMPSLKNFSLRQAKVMITQNGLKVGKIIYISSEYNDLVINQLMNDTLVEAGTVLRKYSTIDLHVGRESRDEATVPYLRGMYYVDAVNVIKRINFNEGAINKDKTITESSLLDSAIIWKQYPQPEVNANLGTSIGLWLTMDTAVVYAADTTLRLR